MTDITFVDAILDRLFGFCMGMIVVVYLLVIICIYDWYIDR